MNPRNNRKHTPWNLNKNHAFFCLSLSILKPNIVELLTIAKENSDLKILHGRNQQYGSCIKVNLEPTYRIKNFIRNKNNFIQECVKLNLEPTFTLSRDELFSSYHTNKIQIQNRKKINRCCSQETVAHGGHPRELYMTDPGMLFSWRRIRIISWVMTIGDRESCMLLGEDGRVRRWHDSGGPITKQTRWDVNVRSSCWYMI
jgi:hypothetical protein